MTKLEAPPAHVPVAEPTENATLGLPEELSARRLLSRGQSYSLAVGTAIAAALLVVYGTTGLGPSFASWGRAVVLFVTVVYVVVISFKLLLVVAAPDKGGWDEARLVAAALAEAALPRYTILVPLHREARVLPELIGRLSALEYPQELLQILFLVERGDSETRDVLAALELDEPFQTVVVPPNGPQTKPRACNVGLALATGDLCVIYDAEDRPDPDQLRRAVAAFADAPRWVVCVQSELQYWNPWTNWLTRNFAAEYAANFSLVLRGLDRFGLPTPLGGTSNHFRTDALRQLGGWDPHNVAEDADIGIRIARRGWRVRRMASVTEEEANSNLRSWLRQRSRWLKGYMQTWLVHMRSPLRLWRDLGTRDFIAFQLVLGCAIFTTLVNPVFWALFVVYLVNGPSHIAVLFPAYIFYPAVAAMLAGNVLMIYCLMSGCMERGLLPAVKVMVLVPAYWALMSVAAYKGLIQLIRPSRRHFWELTEHGLVGVDGTSRKPDAKPRSVAVPTDLTRDTEETLFVGAVPENGNGSKGEASTIASMQESSA
ncbi:MAG TPA: glycosyltransferase family 2 protein [Acidimicrobiales bacterium]|nr:glycosyltransferase family 2 protein [Acidimicrobiales bacterium]